MPSYLPHLANEPFLSSSDKPASCWIRRHLQRHILFSKSSWSTIFEDVFVTLQMCEAHWRLQLDIDQKAHRIWCTQTYWDTTRRIASACFQMHWAWETERLGCFKSSVQLPSRQVPAGSAKFQVAKRPSKTHPTLPCQKCAHAQSHPGSFLLIRAVSLYFEGEHRKSPATPFAKKKATSGRDLLIIW